MQEVVIVVLLKMFFTLKTTKTDDMSTCKQQQLFTAECVLMVMKEPGATLCHIHVFFVIVLGP